MSWRKTRVSEMAQLVNGYPFYSADFLPTGDVPLVRIRDITGGTFETYVSWESAPPSAMIRDGDVVIGMDGDFNVALWQRGPAVLNQRVCLLRATEHADPRYLAYTLPPHLQVINDLTYSTTVKHLSGAQVLHIKFEAPHLDEQRAIADYLDQETAQMDALVAKQEEFIQLLRERRSAISTKMLFNLPTIKLRRLVDPSRPMTYGILQAGEHRSDGVPYLGPSDLPGEGAFPVLDSLRRTSPEIAESYSRSILKSGDIVVSIGPAYGHVAVTPNELTGGNLTQDTVRVALRNELADTRFVILALGSSEVLEYWNSQIQGATFRRLNLGTLAATPIPMTEPSEQRRIAKKIDEDISRIDTLITKAEEHIALAKERRSALITAAVTGQFDVRTARKAG